jgi:hypothetical protein
MMIVYDTYGVTYRLKDLDEVHLRVSEPDLETFLRVLRFNGLEYLVLAKEDRGA